MTRTNHYFGALAVLAALVLAASLLAALAETAEAAFPGKKNGKVVFVSRRTTGAGVNNPEGDAEVFTMNKNGANLKQLMTTTIIPPSPRTGPG